MDLLAKATLLTSLEIVSVYSFWCGNQQSTCNQCLPHHPAIKTKVNNVGHIILQ